MRMSDGSEKISGVTRQEFEQWYAANSGTTVEQLRYFGRYAEPCDCGDEICEGWQMTHAHDDALFDETMRHVG